MLQHVEHHYVFSTYIYYKIKFLCFIPRVFGDAYSCFGFSISHLFVPWDLGKGRHFPSKNPLYIFFHLHLYVIFHCLLTMLHKKHIYILLSNCPICFIVILLLQLFLCFCVHCPMSNHNKLTIMARILCLHYCHL